MDLYKILAFLCCIIIGNGQCARILGIFHVPSQSHHILASKLLKTLAEKGHEVTMISPYPFKNPVKNYRDVFLEEMLQYKQDRLQDVMKPNGSLFSSFTRPFDLFSEMCDIVLSNKQVEKLKLERFDLVIQFALFSECFLGLAHHWNAPVILLSTIGTIPATDKYVGNVSPPSYVSNSFGTSTPNSEEWTFLDRVSNTLGVWSSYVLMPYFMEKKQKALLEKYFPEAPPLQELINNVALLFINSHYSIENPRPYVPNVIEIGGFHIDEPKILPRDLQTFMDEAKDGVVFFSLGSNVKISALPSDKLKAILNVLGKLKMRVLFKTDESLDDLPANIKTGKWLPQNDILAHKNLKLFISHGGALSTIEAVYHGVPIIGIPIFGDQQKNIAEAVAKGFAIKVDLNQLNEEIFSNAINNILNNPKYKENIQLRSSLIRDQPIKPLDKAVFWVEHVLKYKGADHLKNASRKLNLLQYLLIDVIVFLVAIILFIIFILYNIGKIVLLLIKKLLKLLKHKKE